MDAPSWPTEWLRGVLDVCVLAVLDEGPTYGYAISARLDELGLGAVKGGTLYPLLTRLELAGLVTTEWRPGVGGPGRKYFALTTPGRDELRRLGDRWHTFTHVTSRIVDRTSGPPPTTVTTPTTTTRSAP